jgi:hypothetical protein
VLVPANIACAIPVEDSIVATEVLPLTQVPPDTELVKVEDEPLQIVVVPPIAGTEGTVFTVIDDVTAVMPQVPVK